MFVCGKLHRWVAVSTSCGLRLTKYLGTYWTRLHCSNSKSLSELLQVQEYDECRSGGGD